MLVVSTVRYSAARRGVTLCTVGTVVGVVRHERDRVGLWIFRRAVAQPRRGEEGARSRDLEGGQAPVLSDLFARSGVITALIGCPGAQKAQIRALKCRWVSLGVVGCRWVSLGVVGCHLGGPEGGTRYCGWAKPPPTSSGEPGSLRGVLDDSGMKPVRGACMSR